MKEKILIVDNQPLILRMLGNFLEKKGYEVRTALGSLEALEVLGEFIPDIMFIDLVMPRISGDKLCRIVRNMPRLSKVCIIILSAIAAEEILDCNAFGADACIAKGPFGEIEEHITRLLEVRKLQKPFHCDKVIGLESVYQREITKELLSSRTHFEVVLRNIVEGIVECIDDGTVVYVNAAATNILGAREEAILSGSFFDLFEGASRKRIEDAFACIAESPLSIGEDEVIVQGEQRLLLTLVPLIDKGETTVIVIMQDISKRKQTEDRLKGYSDHLEKTVVDRTSELILKNEQLQREILDRQSAEVRMTTAQREWERTFDAVGDIITLQDASFRLTRVNRATGRMFGKECGQLIGMLCYELFHGASEPCPDCPAHATSQDSVSYSREIFHPLLQKTLHLSATPIADDSGQLVGVAHFAKDITEQKKLEKQLLQSQKMEAVGTLAGGIAHDFNNILAAVIGYTDLAMLDLAPNSPAYAKMVEVSRAGRRARDLVAQILAFSRHHEVKRVPLEMSAIVKEALKLLRATLPSTVGIQQEVAPVPVWIMADPVQIHQVLMNLCTNAAHAMRGIGGNIRVVLEEEEVAAKKVAEVAGLKRGPYVRLSVSDSGHGMEKDVMERIFDPFFTTKKAGDGTGLGLAVVHGIVLSHNGAIQVESVPGQGTTFSLYFPRIVAAEEVGARFAETHLPAGEGRIMFIDDEPALANLGRQLLETLGYEAESFVSSREALDRFREAPDAFDLVLTDLTMPEITGAELAKEMLSLRPDIPVVVCTGYTDYFTEEDAKKIGVREYLFKPLSVSKLAQVIQGILDPKKI